MVAIWYLLVLAPFVAIPVLWWNYRRKIRQRESASGARWERLVNTAKADPAGLREAMPSVAPAVAVVAAVPRYARRARALDPAETVVYYLLRSELPDHEVMPHVGLANLLEVPAEIVGSERDQRLRVLAQHTVDFVICNKAMQPVAAIDLLAHEAPAALTSAPDFKTQCLAHTGIRHLRLARTALPKRHEVRALVLGG